MAKVKPKRRSHNNCEHAWTAENRMVDQGRSPAQPAGASPPEYEQIKVCTKCGAERRRADS